MGIKTIALATVRLNKNTKREITEKIVDASLEDERRRLIKMNADIAYDLYAHKYTPEQREFMAAAPKGMFQTVNYFYGHVIDANSREQFNFCHLEDGRKVYEDVPIWAELARNSGATIFVENGSLIGNMILDFERWNDDFKQKRREMLNQVAALVSTMSTTKKLAEAWPESVPYIVALGLEPAEKNIALRTEDLNRFLGLPI